MLATAAIVAGLGYALFGVRSDDDGAAPDAALLDPRSGGDTTALEATTNAFGLSARNLGRGERRLFEIGDSLFTQNWVTAPSSTSMRDGLGPLLNAQACASCHVLDGRARPPAGPDDPERGLLLRLSVPDPGGGPPGPHPAYGDQLQDRAILGVPPEGRIAITYQDRPGSFADGTPFTLRRPSYRIADPAYGPPGKGLQISPRIAQQVVGMGLLEAIPEADVTARADPEDDDGDGVSGRANVAIGRAGDRQLGRFGWKASVATVEDQSAFAFRGDVGITSNRAPQEPCTPPQLACRRAQSGGDPEIDDETLAKVAFYVRTLAVPGRRDLDDPSVRAGAVAFEAAGCTSCHVSTQRTSGGAAPAAVAGQTIHPYTDLLLHDLGPGLADGRPDGLASGREWRTAPLWGIGLVEPINGHTRFLHDGRARSLEEAILWHGGEASRSREWFRTADREQRQALIAFLESL